MGEISSLLDVTLETAWATSFGLHAVERGVDGADFYGHALAPGDGDAMDGGDEQFGGRTARGRGGVDHGRAGQRGFLAFSGADRAQCGERAAGIFQLILNFSVSLCYVLVAVLDTSIISNLDDTTLRAFNQVPHEELGEPFFCGW